MGPEARFYSKVLAYTSVFSSPKGKEVLADMEQAYDHTFDPDPFKSAFLQGRRQVVLDIKRLLALAADPQFTAEAIAAQFDMGGEEEYHG